MTASPRGEAVSVLAIKNGDIYERLDEFFLFGFKKDVPPQTPVIKNWVGIASTSRSVNLDMKAVFEGYLNERFRSEHNSQFSPFFTMQCEIYNSKEEAFRWMGHRIRAKKSTYVLETPYNLAVLTRLIANGHFHECFTQAINVRDYNLFRHALALQAKIEIVVNSNFKLVSFAEPSENMVTCQP